MGNPVVFFEVFANGGDKVRSFYKDLFGWQMNVDPETQLRLRRDRCEQRHSRRHRQTQTASPRCCFVEVPDIDKHSATKLGGKTCCEDGHSRRGNHRVVRRPGTVVGVSHTIDRRCHCRRVVSGDKRPDKGRSIMRVSRQVRLLAVTSAVGLALSVRSDPASPRITTTVRRSREWLITITAAVRKFFGPSRMEASSMPTRFHRLRRRPGPLDQRWRARN